MTHNPKMPWPRRTPAPALTEHPRDAFADRLRRLGAPDDLVEQTREAWDDPEWQNRDDIVGLSDDALRAEIVEIVREHHEGTHTEDEDAEALHQVLLAQAREVIRAPIHEVIAWVVEHPTKQAGRAAAVAEAEGEEAKPRTTLLEQLERITRAEA